MAGTVTVTKAPNFNGEVRERVFTLACVGDAADGGSVPSETLKSLKGYRLTELQTTPGSGGVQPDEYTVEVTDADGGTLLLTSSRSQTAKEYAGGHETLGYYPKIDGNIAIAVSDLGNSNETTLKLKFELKVI